jgi:hypothetical protein
MIDGYKTYVIALIAGIAAVLQVFGGDPKYGGLMLVLAAGLATLRSAIEKSKV